MKNKEKYAKEILEIACNGDCIAFNKTTNKVVPCNRLSCSDCFFDEIGCRKAVKKWSESEYIDPPVDWSKVSVDTPILVRFSGDDKYWVKRHFARYDNGQVRAWVNGTTSWTADGKSDTWTYAKLAEPNNT